MSDDKEKSRGAYRVERGSISRRITSCYGKCSECGLVFYTKYLPARGMGSYARTRASDERDAKIIEESRHWEQFFVEESNRCTCDPVGDREYLRVQHEKSEQDARWRARLEATATTPAPLPVTEKKRRHRSKTASIVDELGQLNDLYRAGALTREQFEAAKNALLGLS